MSNLIRIGVELSRILNQVVSPGGLARNFVDVETTSNLYHQTVQLVGTAAEQIETGDISADSVVIITNLSASVLSVGTNSGSFVEVFNIPEGERAVLPRVGTLADLYLKSSIASNQVEVLVFNIT